MPSRKRDYLCSIPAILKALAEKLIPGIPLSTRISILQQTATEEPPQASTEEQASRAKPSPVPEAQLSVLAEVIDRATSRNEIQCEIDSEPMAFLLMALCSS